MLSERSDRSAGGGELITLDRVIAALRHPLRREILVTLLRTVGATGGMSIAQVARALEIDRLTASHHLALLVEASLVTSRRVGTSKLHSLNPAQLNELDDWLYPFMTALDARQAS